MKKILILALVGLIGFSSFTFADVSNTDFENDRPGLEKIREGRPERPTDPQVRKEVFRERLSQVIIDNNLDLLDDFEDAWNRHDEIHDLLEAHRNEIIGALKAEKEIYKEKIESGEMTREEVKAEIQLKRAEHQEQKDLIKEEIEALKEVYGFYEGLGKDLHDNLKLAIESGNVDSIYDALLDILNSLENHIAFDQEKYQIMINY